MVTQINMTYDEYGNRNKGLQDTIRIGISPSIDNKNFVATENADGSINYSLTLRKAQTYKINSAINKETKKEPPFSAIFLISSYL